MSKLTPFQALVCGSIAGALMKAEHLLIDVEVQADESGENYTNEIVVTGRESKERLLVSVTTLEEA